MFPSQFSASEYLDLALSSNVQICILAFVLGGVVKGTLGVGLPLLAVPLMALIIPSSRAMGLVAVPVILSNIWQMIDTKLVFHGWRRFWPLIGMQFISTIVTVKLTSSLSVQHMNWLVAFSMILAVSLMISKPSFEINALQEKKVSAFIGVISGILGGISSLTGPVVITYLMALKLNREDFIGCISLIYLASGLPLYGAMLYYQRIDALDLGYSTMALIPMAIGLMMGKLIRNMLSESIFRRVLYLYLICVAIALILHSA